MSNKTPHPASCDFRGSFIRESFTLSRQHSVSSILSENQRFRLNTISRAASVIDKSSIKDEDTRFNKSFHYLRFIIVVLGGLAVGFMSLLRLNITVAILNMVNQTKIFVDENPESDVAEYFGENYVEKGEFDWDNEIQQLIISYYMIAYTLPQLFTTKLAMRVGINLSIAISLGLCALSCIITPLVAQYGWQYVTLLRLINGLGASAILPMMVHIIEVWMPASEHIFGLAVVQTVQSLVFTLSPLISGALADIHWKWAFYVPAAAAILFCLIWILLAADNPTKSRLISGEELNLICGCSHVTGDMPTRVNDREPDRSPYRTNEKDVADTSADLKTEVPWTRALRLKSFYALTGVWIFYQSSFGSLSFLIASYMNQVLKVPIFENGMLCFIIQSGCVLSVIWPQPILRILQVKCNLSLTVSRRIVLTMICVVVVTTWLLVAGFHKYQVVLLSINRIFHLSTDTIVTGTIMSQYASSGIGSMVYSTINSIGNLSTVFFCLAVGRFLDISGGSIECWSWIFVSMALMNVGLILLFDTMIRSEPVDLRTETTHDEPMQPRSSTCKA